MLKLRQISAGYGEKEILKEASLTVPEGKITVLLGPNGCGKSTLLKTIGGILPAKSGDVTFRGESLEKLSQREKSRIISYFPQHRQVPEISVGRLVLHGRFPYLSYPRHYRREDWEAADRAMEKAGVRELSERMVSTLSGGQRQKVYLAMVLCQDAPVVLLDEPAAFLDIAHRLQLMEQAAFLAKAGKTVLLVVHDLSMAMKCADHLAVMKEGRILAEGSVEEIYASRCLETAFDVQVCRVDTADGWQYYCK